LDPRAEDVSIEGELGEPASGIPLTIAAPLMQCLVALPKPFARQISILVRYGVSRRERAVEEVAVITRAVARIESHVW
jgi:hypothetical protein